MNTVGDLAGALIPFLGAGLGRLVFSLGILGAAMVAAIVVSLALAWGVGEVAGYKRSLELRPGEAGWFYGIYGAGVVGCAALVLVWPDLVNLNVDVQIMNALLLPLVLGFLVALAGRVLCGGAGAGGLDNRAGRVRRAQRGGADVAIARATAGWPSIQPL